LTGSCLLHCFSDDAPHGASNDPHQTRNNRHTEKGALHDAIRHPQSGHASGRDANASDSSASATSKASSAALKLTIDSSVPPKITTALAAPHKRPCALDVADAAFNTALTTPPQPDRPTSALATEGQPA
jgi:hypothetical protein